MAAHLPLRRNYNFLLLQSGQLLSAVGSSASTVAFPLLALALTHSPAKAGLVGFVEILPYPLLMLPAGVLVDRVDRKRVMVVADAARAVAALSLGIALARGHASYVQLLAVAFAETSCFAFFNLAESGALRAVVPREQLPEAMAWEQSRYGAVVVGGPPLGGVLFGIARSLPFLADAFTYVFSTLSILAIRVRFQEERTKTPLRFRADIAEGFRFLWGQPFLRTCAFLFVGSNFVWSGLFLVEVVAARRQGLSSSVIGLLVAYTGAIALLGGVLAPRIQRRLSMRMTVVVTFWLPLGILLYVAHPNVWLIVVGLTPFGLLNSAMNSSVIGYRTAVTPDRLQGRVLGVARLLAQAASPLGPLVAGLLLSATSPRTTVVVFAVWIGVLALVATIAPALRDAPSLDELKTAPALD